MENFDAYHEWLGIPPSEQPPDHYRLLGIAAFEENASVIANAAERQMRQIRVYARGDFTEEATRLLGEIADAKLCLISAEKKAEYDRQLRDARQEEEEEKDEQQQADAENILASVEIRSWTIGSGSCDIVVDSPVVSRLHCKLTRTANHLYLDDLQSTNGTYVNGAPIKGRCAVRRSDVITLGRQIKFPWPKDL